MAWPAEYGVTGINTFIVNQDGVVYQKDIAPVPGKAPLPITRFDPDHSWEPVESVSYTHLMCIRDRIMVLSGVLRKFSDLAVVGALLVINAVLSFMPVSYTHLLRA